MARYHDTEPVSGWTGHVPGAKWQVGSRSASMNALNQTLNESTSHPHTAQNHSSIGANPGESGQNGAPNLNGPLPQLQIPNGIGNPYNGPQTGVPGGSYQPGQQGGPSPYTNYGLGGPGQGPGQRGPGPAGPSGLGPGQGGPSVQFLPQLGAAPISPQAIQSIQNYAGSLAQSGQALANSAQALAREVSNVQALIQQQQSASSFPGNPSQAFFANSTNPREGMIGSTVPMPYPNDSQISQFGFNSQGMPVRIPSDVQRQYQQQQQTTQRIQNADGSYSVITTNRVKGTGYGRNGDVRQAREQVRTTASEAQRRVKSLPRKVEKDPFEGLEGGLYSKGEVARNRERREMAMKGIPVQGGDWKATNRGRGDGGGGDGERRAQRRIRDLNDRPPFTTGGPGPGGGGGGGGGPGGAGGLDIGPDGLDGSLGGSYRNRNYLEDEEEDQVPAAGYSGHIPAYKRISVGKNFHTAALEAKKEYIKNRYGEREASEVLNPNRAVAFDDGHDWMNPAMQSMSLSTQPGGQSFNQPMHNVSQYAGNYVDQARNYANQGLQHSRSVQNFQQFANQSQGYPQNIQNLPY